MLYSTYNDLIEKTEQLMELNQQESRQKRKAELQALQYQINPHFLYNTLDSINAMAVLKDENEISEMTTALASLMRLSLSQKEEFVTLENELKHVRAYIDIQKIRYSNRFQVSFSVDESILQHRVVRLILQPLVENAIRHGLEPKEEEGNLAVRAFACGKWIVLQVWDDGVIVDPETVKQIARNLKDHKKPDPESSHSIGLYNVNERIRLYYNDAGSMYFQSNAHCGTTVSILIPADMKGGNR